MMSGQSSAAAPSTHSGDNASPGPASELPHFSVIYQTYFSFVWRCVRRLGIAPSAVDDVVQDVFIVIHSRLSTLITPSALRSWIYGIVRRTVLAHGRLDRARAESALTATEESTAPSLMPTPLDIAEHSDQVKMLWLLLQELDAPKREVFVLAEIEEMTMPEVAHALEIPLGTVYSRLRSARQLFEAALARHDARSRRGGAP